MNIAFINSEHPSRSGRDQGGIATYIYIMANALHKAGHAVHILVRKNTLPEELDEGIHLHTFDHTPVKKPFSFLSRIFNGPIFWEKGCSKAAFEVIRQLHAQTPLDIVEIPEYNGMASQFFQPLPFTCVINFHTPSILIDELNHTPVTSLRKQMYAYERRAVKNGTAFRCPAESLARKIKTIFSLRKEPVTIINNPIPTAAFDAIRKKSPAPHERIDILFSGRLERRKGAEIIQQAINKILDINTHIHITFAGETEIGESASYRQAIERAVGDEKRSRVWFLGPLDRKNLALLYRRSDIFLMPSLYENSPYALLEAIAARLPVVGANTAGINEIIKHKETGLLFSLDNLNELYACINELIASPDRTNLYVKNAYDMLQKNYNPEVIVQKTVAFYTSIKRGVS